MGHIGDAVNVFAGIEEVCVCVMWVCRCVVWTGDGRVFFYNPSQRMSLWERPEELQGRADVDKMVQNPPETGNSFYCTSPLQFCSHLS